MIRQLFTNMAQAPRVMFAKQTVLRHQSPFEINLNQYAPSDYDKIIPALLEAERQLMEKPADAQGMRWVHFDETTYFYAEHNIDLNYDLFVKKVDICHAGEFYRDSISVATQVVSQDKLGRPVLQAVRVVALPQPNYAAFLGKGNLDVYKLEKVEHNKDEQRVWMHTVHSPNGSAICDDGYLAFKRTPGNKGVLIVFLACQNFPFPPVIQWLQIHRWHWLKNQLVESAYRQFFQTMVNNILDSYHDRDFRVGQPCSSH